MPDWEPIVYLPSLIPQKAFTQRNPGDSDVSGQLEHLTPESSSLVEEKIIKFRLSLSCFQESLPHKLGHIHGDQVLRSSALEVSL